MKNKSYKLKSWMKINFLKKSISYEHVIENIYYYF
jgi:hypothetical protein